MCLQNVPNECLGLGLRPFKVPIACLVLPQPDRGLVRVSTRLQELLVAVLGGQDFEWNCRRAAAHEV